VSGETDWWDKLEENPLVGRLTREGSTQSMTFWGYIGQAGEGFITLHTSLENLGDSLEIPVADILHVEDVPESVLLFGGKVVWVRRDANVTRRQGEVASTLDKNLRKLASSEKPRMGAQDGSVVEREEGRLRMQMRPRAGTEAGTEADCHSPCATCKSCSSVCISTCRTTV
jgi:hypothetical protein